MPDSAVETKSPSDNLKRLRQKAEHYLQNGVKMVWLLYPEKQSIEVLTPEDFSYLTANGTLTGGDLLPEFSVTVADLFKTSHA